MKESTSAIPFLTRTAIVSAITGILTGIAIALRWGWPAASGFVVALAWGLANFAVLAIILRAITDPAGARIAPAIGWIAIKVVGLYGAAVWILTHRWFPLWAFVVGFSWPLWIGGLRAITPTFLNRGARARHAA